MRTVLKTAAPIAALVLLLVGCGTTAGSADGAADETAAEATQESKAKALPSGCPDGFLEAYSESFEGEMTELTAQEFFGVEVAEVVPGCYASAGQGAVGGGFALIPANAEEWDAVSTALQQSSLQPYEGEDAPPEGTLAFVNEEYGLLYAVTYATEPSFGGVIAEYFPGPVISALAMSTQE